MKVMLCLIITAASFEGTERKESGTMNNLEPFLTASSSSTTNGSNVTDVANNITSDAVHLKRELQRKHR